MTFEEHWAQRIALNPELAFIDTKIRITAAEFRRCLKVAYERGAEHARNEKSIFQTIFGK